MSVCQYFPREGSQLRIPTLLPEKLEHLLNGVLTHKQFFPANSETPNYEALSYVRGNEGKGEHMAISQGHHQKKTLIGTISATTLHYFGIIEPASLHLVRFTLHYLT
jgi:hypothetical protein